MTNATSPNVTIVTACDRNYLWGAFLLIASASRYMPHVPIHLLQGGFTEQDHEYFLQFPQVKVIPLSEGNHRNVSNRKSEAIFSAATEYIAWMDADCMIIGDVSSRLVPSNGHFQIRLREPSENAWVWSKHYAPGETRGPVPQSVLQQWRQDIPQAVAPNIETTCVANTFVIHRQHLDFIQQWSDHINRFLPNRDDGLVVRAAPAYFMIDESVLSSLVTFSPLAPPIAPFELNRDPRAHVAHFGASPKPWQRWRKQFWYCHREVMDLIDWLNDGGKKVPPLPWAFQRSNTPWAWLLAQFDDAKQKVRSKLGAWKRRVQ